MIKSGTLKYGVFLLMIKIQLKYETLIITLIDFSMTLDYWDSLLTQELLTTKLVELFTNSLTTILMGDCLLIHIISDQGMLNDINLDKLMFIIL